MIDQQRYLCAPVFIRQQIPHEIRPDLWSQDSLAMQRGSWSLTGKLPASDCLDNTDYSAKAVVRDTYFLKYAIASGCESAS